MCMDIKGIIYLFSLNNKKFFRIFGLKDDFVFINPGFTCSIEDWRKKNLFDPFTLDVKNGDFNEDHIVLENEEVYMKTEEGTESFLVVDPLSVPKGMLF